MEVMPYTSAVVDGNGLRAGGRQRQHRWSGPNAATGDARRPIDTRTAGGFIPLLSGSPKANTPSPDSPETWVSQRQ